MLKTNEKKLIEVLLQCQPGHPKSRGNWGVDHTGEPFLLPSIGGITMNVQVGDSAFGWVGDHIEPGVSCIANTHKPFEHPNVPLQVFACVGNKARIISGAAKGKTGTVIGHHGGSEHLVVEFPKAVKQKMTYDDKITICSKGQGLELLDFPEIKAWNLAPELLKKMKIKAADGVLQVPVTTIVPAPCMGSGVGSANVAKGDYDIMTSDPKTVKKYKLDKIRFGDFVALQDHDNRFGRAYVQGAITIGIVIHSDCMNAGHGPGVTTLLTAATPKIKPIINPKANIADLLKIGTGAKA